MQQSWETAVWAKSAKCFTALSFFGGGKARDFVECMNMMEEWIRDVDLANFVVSVHRKAAVCCVHRGLIMWNQLDGIDQGQMASLSPLPAVQSCLRTIAIKAATIMADRRAQQARVKVE